MTEGELGSSATRHHRHKTNQHSRLRTTSPNDDLVAAAAAATTTTTTTTTFTYIYPQQPFSVQYYQSPTDHHYGNSYPGSSILHSHHLLHYPHPSSPPFSPTLLLSSANNPAFVLSPPLLPQQNTIDKNYDLLDTHSQNVYVRGLSSKETDETFYNLCKNYGSISSSKAILDQKTGKCKGYGFVMYENPKHCQQAIQGLNTLGYQASLARIGQESFSSRLKSLQDETSTNIYISNLPFNMNEQDLEELFKPYPVLSNRILRDQNTGLSRGVGFARLVNRPSAMAIIEKFNGYSISGSSLAPLQVRFADSPAQKKLKHQTTTNKKSPANLIIRPVMPVTPETILGIAPPYSSIYHR
ncbi:uncharacterized protein BX663DRAFT_486402 [Cokeromyces recurvatus]|uniref:uncharacterized protein n=1 Tax=Cokeromyces recurvatus TaxID=90255 RepID=UPI0022208C30|nr:uncharacterized protein BX663DRAFT_486402 [Cokeromyces recurvatus]KAI7902589.1 hypothetical protein BX663DRAFT_486402 [Cokeromyces recurvatus]